MFQHKMTLFDLLTNIFFSKKVIIKNLIIAIIFNIFGLIYIFYTDEKVDVKTIIFTDIPINASTSIYQNYDIRRLVKEGVVIKINQDEFGFQIWDHKFDINTSDLNEEIIDLLSTVLFRSIIDHKLSIESTMNIDPTQRYTLTNINNYIQSNRIKDYKILEPDNNKKEFQKILSIIIQANIFAMVIIFIFRVRMINKNS